MKMLTSAGVLVAVTLGLSACGGSHMVTVNAGPDLVRAGLPAPLVMLIHSFGKDRSVTAKRVEVYGPGSRRALVRASSGDLVQKIPAERNGFYLIVLHGHFVAGSHPAGTKAPRGTVETQVWSAKEGVTDTGISNRLPAGVSQLRGPTPVSIGSPARGRAGAQVSAMTHTGLTSIPGLTKIAASRPSICSGYKGQPPSFCRPGRALFSTRGTEQVWALTPAVRRYGIHHLPLPIPFPLARHYPGPSYVVIDVFTTPSAATAQHYLPIYTHTEGYTALPQATVNSGLAARIHSPSTDGLREFRFAWTSGSTMVEVNILGAGMNVSQARGVASRVHPS
jgi:hypothetical protein